MSRALNRLPSNPFVARLRWVMIAGIAFSMILTLGGQPESFWHDPATAIRGDGLSIHAATNHTFEFFLGRGALPYVAANLLYMAVAFFVVSRLPRTLALIAVFSMIFAHGYGATNWLATRFHLGVGMSPGVCGTLLGVLLSFAILPTSDQPHAVAKAWRWVMVATLFVDFANTLLGQPASYWHDPATMHEGNTLTRLFLGRSWIHFLGLEIAIAAGEFALVTFLPLPVAFVCAFAFTFGNFIGASNWFFYEQRLGWVTPVAYGVFLSTLMVALAMRSGGLNEKKAVPTEAGGKGNTT